MKPGTLVRARDGMTGVAQRTHQDFHDDPVQVLVEWHDGHFSWHTIETLEVTQEPLTPERSEEDSVVLTATLDTLARNLVRIRGSRGMSQYKFAPYIGMTRAHLADLETGRRDISLSVFVGICLRLNMNPNELLELQLRADAE